jgi:hypothetical protein
MAEMPSSTPTTALICFERTAASDRVSARFGRMIRNQVEDVRDSRLSNR